MDLLQYLVTVNKWANYKATVIKIFLSHLIVIIITIIVLWNHYVCRLFGIISSNNHSLYFGIAIRNLY